MRRKAALQLSVSFLVIIIICIVIFSFSIYFIKRFFTHAENIKMIYDERTEKEIERLLDDGSKIAIPFDKKTIYNGEFKTFGIGVLNTLDIGSENDFQIKINFTNAYDKNDGQITSFPTHPDTWLKTTSGEGEPDNGLVFTETIKNNEQEKFLLGVEPKNAPAGLYIFDFVVCVDAGDKIKDDTTGRCPFGSSFPDLYDSLHKLYVEVP